MAASTNALHIPSTSAALPAGWQWERLEDVCRGVFDCPHSTPVLTPDGPLIARSQDIRSGVFRVDEAAHISEDTYRERINRTEPVFGDLLYSREGTYFGIAAEVPPSTRLCLGQRMVLLRPEPTTVHFRFLRYWLNSPVMARHIHGHRDGTVAERLNLPIIRGLPVALPPLSEQRAIGHILGTLDDKLELNRRMNEMLESIARAFFQSWFVDFDPVCAKAEGRDPSLPKHLADLFPDSFKESELGEIPKGWEVKPLSELIELAYGKALKEGDRQPGSIRVFGSNGQVGWHNKRLVAGPGIVVGRKGNPGTVTWSPTDFFPIDTTFYVVPKDHCRSLHFLFHALRNQNLSSLNADSAVPGLNRNRAYMNMQVVPGEPILRLFDEQIRVLSERIQQNTEESSTLTTLLGKSKTRGKAVVRTTFEGQRDRTHSSSVTCSHDVAFWARLP